MSAMSLGGEELTDGVARSTYPGSAPSAVSLVMCLR
jgi:hypothetical protein